MIVLQEGDKQGEPRAQFEVPGVLSFTFDLLCVWRDLDARELIAQRNVSLLPLLPFARGASEGSVGEAMEILAQQPRTRGVELQAALVTFAGRVFPAVSWADRIPEEILMESTIFTRGIAKGRVDMVARLLRYRLSEGKAVDAVEALVTMLPRCSDEVLDQISLLVIDKKKEDLLAAVEDLISKGNNGAKH